MLPNGPPVGRPGFGSHVSNWLGAPQSQSRMQCFCAFFVSCGKDGIVKQPRETRRTAPARRPRALSEKAADAASARRCGTGREARPDGSCVHLHGVVRNSALVMQRPEQIAHRLARACPARLRRKAVGLRRLPPHPARGHRRRGTLRAPAPPASGRAARRAGRVAGSPAARAPRAPASSRETAPAGTSRCSPCGSTSGIAAITARRSGVVVRRQARRDAPGARDLLGGQRPFQRAGEGIRRRVRPGAQAHRRG